jgi:hypothetical protein
MATKTISVNTVETPSIEVDENNFYIDTNLGNGVRLNEITDVYFGSGKDTLHIWFKNGQHVNFRIRE